jgi:thioesterase domain-containing protein
VTATARPRSVPAQPPNAAPDPGFAGLLLDLDNQPGRLRSVLIHPAGGGLLPYLAVASHLARRGPVRAIRAAGLIEGETPHDDIPAMADGYANLLAAGPTPNLIFGWSMGGVLAWEVAERLARTDRHGTGPAVFMVDSPAGPAEPETDWAAAKQTILQHAAIADAGLRQLVIRTIDAHLRALARHSATPVAFRRALLLACGKEPDVASRLGDWPGRAPTLAIDRLPCEHFDVFTPQVLPMLLPRLDSFIDSLLEGSFVPTRSEGTSDD